MIIKILLTIAAMVGVYALMAGFWPAAFDPISATFFVPGTKYSPSWAHVILLGTLICTNRIQSK